MANPQPVPAMHGHHNLASPPGHTTSADGGLQRIQAEMNAALASMSDAIWIADAEGRTVRVNDAFLRVHRFSDPLPKNLSLEDYFGLFLVRRTDGTAVVRAQWPGSCALRGETAREQVLEVQRSDTGETWLMSYSYTPIMGEGGASIAGAVVTSREVTEEFRIRRDLEASRARMRRLLAAKDSATEQERRRIAQDLHDDLQQHLAAIRIELAAAVNGWVTAPDELAALVRRAHDLSGEAIESVRRIVQDLRPRVLDGEGLSSALRSLAEGFGERTQLRCQFVNAGAEDDMAGLRGGDTLDGDLAVTLYRVAQEALTNVYKHAKATSVDIRLDHNAAGRVCLSIQDDGIGVSAPDLSRNHSLGILGMQERLATHGGQLDVRCAPAGGTVVEAQVPAAALVTDDAIAEREREREWQTLRPGFRQ
ncbi:MAG: histidine kinase [Rubrivivax sp.]